MLERYLRDDLYQTRFSNQEIKRFSFHNYKLSHVNGCLTFATSYATSQFLIKTNNKIANFHCLLDGFFEQLF
jgi:hypothetical protein